MQASLQRDQINTKTIAVGDIKHAYIRYLI